jgi:carboxymethylenebutenolidase
MLREIVGPLLVGRRYFFKSISTVAFGAFAAVLLVSPPGWASPRPAQTANADTSTVSYDSGGTNISAYLAKPKTAGKHAAVIVVHDTQGLSDDIRDTAQKFAAEGFVALAPDLLSRSGGAKSPEETVAAVRALSPMDTVNDVQAAFAYLQKSPDVDSAKISVIGFGWGGWRAFMLATAAPTLYRTVIYSGATPVPDQPLKDIHSPVMGNYGQYDYQNAGNTIWTAKTMKEFGKKYTSYIYPKAMAGFYNPKGRQYDAEAAKTAWTRTLEFLKS